MSDVPNIEWIRLGIILVNWTIQLCHVSSESVLVHELIRVFPLCSDPRVQ
jgi:hypothetical protein